MRHFLPALLLLSFAFYSPAQAQEQPLKVTGLYPSESFYTALTDFSTQIGYTLNVGDLDPEDELSESIWLVARDITPEKMAELLTYSSEYRVHLRHSKREIVVSERPEITVKKLLKTRGYNVASEIKILQDYINQYGEKGDADKANQSPGYELLGLVEAVVTTSDDSVGSTVGSRLLFSETEQMQSEIGGFLKLLKSANGGESQQAAHVRKLLDGIRNKKVEETLEGGTLMDALWVILGGVDLPVAIHPEVLEEIQFDDEMTVSLDKAGDSIAMLRTLASEYGFGLEISGDTLFLAEASNESSPIYRVFNSDALLKQIEKDYEEQKSEGVVEGFHGDLKIMGGIEVIEDALAAQLQNHGYDCSVYSWGTRLIVVGSLVTIDVSVDVLKELGWKQPVKTNE
ncbi:MAG: hypothetical protein L3J82_08350 [Planctomycetes bacterium]|nr:hypothetical protein [Planctomycetota bacterium]